VQRPRLAWPGEVVGKVHAEAAMETGIPVGTPVLAGTVDALAEAYGAGCRCVGDTMLMYGSTMFLIQTVETPKPHAGLWAAAGRSCGTCSAVAGMATSGLITEWLAAALGRGIGQLVADAGAVPAGSAGLILLPYFAGERTPLFDARARGCWLGLTLHHGVGHLYRSVLEGVGYGVRHNLETMTAAGATAARLVAVGGGTRGELWTQIVSDVTGHPQDIPGITVGASYGNARAAADAIGINTTGWNPIVSQVRPRHETRDVYEALYGVYRRAYQNLREDLHVLSAV
jgi:xylulokinase